MMERLYRPKVGTLWRYNHPDFQAKSIALKKSGFPTIWNSIVMVTGVRPRRLKWYHPDDEEVTFTFSVIIGDSVVKVNWGLKEWHRNLVEVTPND